jgi:MFS superfamily sulfate permease-like transporter
MLELGLIQSYKIGSISPLARATNNESIQAPLNSIVHAGVVSLMMSSFCEALAQIPKETLMRLLQ